MQTNCCHTDAGACVESQRLLFESHPLPMWLCDGQTLAFLAVNEAAIRHYGYTREEFLARTIKDIRPPEDIPRLLATVAVDEPGPKGIWRHVKKDGTIIAVEITPHELQIGGRPIRLVMAHDVTERQRAEQALLTSEMRYRLMVETAEEGIWLVDQQWRITFANARLGRLLGYDVSQLLGRPLHDFLDARARHSFEEHMARRKQGLRETYDIQLIRSDGTSLWVLVAAAPRLDGAGNFDGALAMATDISERKQTEDLLQAANGLLRLANEALSHQEYLDRVAELVQAAAECQCVGIRMLDDQGWIPYESYRGFPAAFWSRENRLLLKRDGCVCTRIIQGRPAPPDLPAMTPRGTFHTSHLSEFAKRFSEADRVYYRAVCLECGFESLAILPIRHEQRTWGLIHLADDRPGRFTARKVAALETLAPLVGAALDRRRLQDALRESEASLRRAERMAHIGYWDINPATAHAGPAPRDPDRALGGRIQPVADPASVQPGGGGVSLAPRRAQRTAQGVVRSPGGRAVCRSGDPDAGVARLPDRSAQRCGRP